MILPLPPPPHHRRIFLLCFGIPAAYSSDCTLNTTLIRAHTARTPKLIHTLIQSAHTAHTPKLIRTHTAQTPHTHSFPYNQGQQIPYTHIHIPCMDLSFTKPAEQSTRVSFCTKRTHTLHPAMEDHVTIIHEHQYRNRRPTHRGRLRCPK